MGPDVSLEIEADAWLEKGKNGRITQRLSGPRVLGWELSERRMRCGQVAQDFFHKLWDDAGSAGCPMLIASPNK